MIVPERDSRLGRRGQKRLPSPFNGATAEPRAPKRRTGVHNSQIRRTTMLKRNAICSSFLMLILSLTPALAQNEVAKTNKTSAVAITASASGERVRFTAPSSAVQIRLEIYNSTGRKLFDNEVHGGNVLDWHLQDGQAEPLPDDSYLC